VAHASRVVESCGGADQDLLGIAAAQGAGAAERKVIDYGDAPSGGAASAGGDARRRPGSDDD
jgi:hypothetical protein